MTTCGTEGLGRLSLAQLRACRHALDNEEIRVSYWRRLIQARADVIRAGGRRGIPDRAALQRVLTEHQAASVRTCVLRALPDEDFPSLPDVAGLWSRLEDDDDVNGRQVHLAELAAVEASLSAYRRILHERLDAATAELVGRYRAEPLLCLAALPGSLEPSPPPRPARL